MLVGVTLLSILFAWQFYYRGQKVRERDRIIAIFSNTESHVGFRYSLLGWEVPFESAWLWRVAIPELHSICIRTNSEKHLPETLCEIARRCTKIEYEGHEGGDDDFLRRCTSPLTESITVTRNGVTGDCLAFVGECPNLQFVEVRFVTLQAKSLAALFNHPRLEELVADVDADGIAQLGELNSPCGLRKLEITPKRDWRLMQAHVAGGFRIDDEPNAEVPHAPQSDYAWLKQCQQLEEVRDPQDIAFLTAIGRHLQGVERLELRSFSRESLADALDSLGAWTRLRFLALEGLHIQDDNLERLVARCENLHTLEIDEYSDSSVSISPEALRSLQKLSGLKRLRLGMCNLKREHISAIAELGQLEELSFEDDSLDDLAMEPLFHRPNIKRISLERTSVKTTKFAKIQGDWNPNRPWRN
jgi:hypothetical protein